MFIRNQYIYIDIVKSLDIPYIDNIMASSLFRVVKKTACNTNISARYYSSSVSEFVSAVADHRAKNPGMYAPKDLANMVDDREAAKNAILKAKARAGNENIASFALASTGVNAASVLSNLSTHRLTKGGALKLGGKGGKVNTMTAGFANGSAKEISYDESDAILADNTQFLSTCKAVYLEDSTIGTSVNVKGVTDDVNAAGLFKAMFNRSHGAYNSNATVTAYFAAGAKDGKTSLIATENGKSHVVLSADMGASDVLNAMADAVNAAQPGTLLPCDVVVSGDDVTLDFTSTNAKREKAFKAGNLFSGHHAILTSNGVERAWGCVAVKKGHKASGGDVTFGNGEVAAINSSAGNIISNPTSAKFKDGTINNNGDLNAFKAEIMDKLNGSDE